MKLHYLDVLNFCQHQQRLIEFRDGLTAFIGPNGSGKSNLLGAVRFALTGENPNAGTKDANICQLADVSMRSHVRLAFSHAGTRAVVHRHLRPTSAQTTLEVEGAATIRGDNRVNARIFEILGVDHDILNDIAIVPQDQIFGFLAKTPAKRAEAFQKLFRTEKADLLHELLRKRIASTSIPAAGEDLDAVTARYNSAAAELTAIQGQLVGQPDVTALQRSQLDDLDVIRTNAVRIGHANRLATSQQNWQQLIIQHDAACKQVEKLRTDLETLRQAAEGSRAACDEARAILTNLEQHTKLVAWQAKIASQQATVRASLAALKVPTPPANFADVSAQYQSLVSERGTKTTQYETDTRFLGSFDPGRGAAECPTCHTPVTSLSSELDAARLRIPELCRRITEISADLRARDHYVIQDALYTQNAVQLNSQLQQLEAQKGELPAATTATVDEPAMRQRVATYNDYLTAIAEYERQRSSAEQTMSRIAGQRDAVAQQMDLDTQALRAMTITDDLAAAAQTRVDQRQLQIAERTRSDQALAVAGAKVAELQTTLTLLTQTAAAAVQTRRWVNYLENLRGLFHSSAAPRFVAQRNLRRLEAGINESLQLFEAPYRVAANEGLSFVASFTDGRVQPAERLSVGQKVILVLAFRLALNFMAAADLGFLALDEPTAWLDTHHVRAFRPVLTRLREISAARGLQVLIVTHEQELAPLFDAVVQL